jgi:hypothetical protein
MKIELITIENGIVSVPACNIWMSEYEIAALFECFVGKVSSNVREILKTGVLREAGVCRTFRYGNGNSVDQYSLEMISALAFRIKSHHAELFREYMMRKMTAGSTGEQILVNMLHDTALLN